MNRVHELIADIDRLTPGESLDVEPLRILAMPGFRSAFQVDDATMASAGAMNLAFGQDSIDGDRLRTRCTTSVLLDGEPVPGWAPLSGYYDTQHRMGGAAKTLRQKWWRVRTTRQRLEPSQLRTTALSLIHI